MIRIEWDPTLRPYAAIDNATGWGLCLFDTLAAAEAWVIEEVARREQEAMA